PQAGRRRGQRVARKGRRPGAPHQRPDAADQRVPAAARPELGRTARLSPDARRLCKRSRDPARRTGQQPARGRPSWRRACAGRAAASGRRAVEGRLQAPADARAGRERGPPLACCASPGRARRPQSPSQRPVPSQPAPRAAAGCSREASVCRLPKNPV
ncbi:hypothetical protein H4S06_003785, partial [Coemansia sp. BCRC 34490]